MSYTNSSLVVYTKYSPYHSGTRTHPISKITIHHMAGNLSVETCGNVFQSSESSSNYGIGTDGRIALYVDEKNRSWASSSAWNDNRAVTIEVANNKIGGNWSVSDKAMNSLIKLCVDICKRNGIKKLEYTGDKNGSLTIHSMFAATACPGPYLKSKLNYIASEVNKQLNATTKTNNTTNKTTNKTVNVTYRVKAGGKWLGEIKNLTDYAGIENKPITDVAIKVDKGSVKYRVHVLGGGWLGWITGYNIKDAIKGYAGNGKPIDAIQVYYYTPDTIRPYKQAYYRVSPIGNKGYYSYQTDTDKTTSMDGYAGCYGVKIDKLQIQIK